MENFMKALLSLLCLMPALCLANPFDDFTGNYISDSTPRISTENNARCFRYAFYNLEGIEIIKSAAGEGYNQTHTIVFNSILNNSPISISHAIMEYRDNVGMGGVAFAETKGADGHAENTMGSRSDFYAKSHTVKIGRNNNGISLEMTESVKTPQGSFSCEYGMDFIAD
jgi:hypothetical protein